MPEGKAGWHFDKVEARGDVGYKKLVRIVLIS